MVHYHAYCDVFNGCTRASDYAMWIRIHWEANQAARPKPACMDCAKAASYWAFGLRNNCIGVAMNGLKRDKRDKYSPEFVEIAFKMSLKGKSKKQIAERMCVNSVTVYDWERRYPDFRRAIDLGNRARINGLFDVVEAMLAGAEMGAE